MQWNGDLMPRAVFIVFAVFATSCTPAGESNSRAPATSAREDSPAPVRDAAADVDDSAGAKYLRREWVITRGNGTLVFEAPGNAACTALPDKRPSDFSLILVRRGGEPGDWTYYGLSEKTPCHFPWGMSWMDPPQAACKALDPTAYDKLYAELRKLAPETIHHRRMAEYVSPHRGGWSIHWRWGAVECAVSDIMDNEVDDKDRPRFDAVQDLVRKAYQAP